MADNLIHSVYAKRPFGPLISGGFRTGKRNSISGVRFDKQPTDTENLPENKRLFGDVFGGGYKFGNPYSPGKRASDKYFGGGSSIFSDRRPFGYPVGGRHRFGQPVIPRDRFMDRALSSGLFLSNPVFTRQSNIGLDEDGVDEDTGDYYGVDRRSFNNLLDDNSDDFIQKRPFGPITGSRFRFKRTADRNKLQYLFR